MSESEHHHLLSTIDEDQVSYGTEGSPLLKRKHLNKDCTHWVPLDFQTIIYGAPDEKDDHEDDKWSWIYRLFCGNKKRKTATTILTIICCGILLTATGYYVVSNRVKISSSDFMNDPHPVKTS